MSADGLYSNPYFSAGGDGHDREDVSSDGSERSEPPVWQAAVDSRGELFYAELEEGPVAGGCREPGELPVPPPPPVTGKLQHLLRRRRSQKTDLGSAGPLSPRRRAPAARPAQGSAAPAGEVYRIIIRLDSVRRPGPLCESLLGLIGGHQLGSSENPQEVTVAALAPRGPLIRHPRVGIGDRLERVDGVSVSPENLETVLAALPRPGKARLSFRRAPAQPQLTSAPGAGAPLTNGVSKPEDPGDGDGANCTTGTSITTGRVTSLTGDGLCLEELGRLLRGVPFGLLCLTTEGLSETAPDRQDVVYQFPGYDTALMSARGALLTVAGLTRQISGDTPLRAAVTVGSAAVHLAVTCQEELVLLLAAPEVSLSAPELHQLGTELWQLLRLEFGSLRSAFLDASQRTYVDHLLALVFQQALLTPELTAGLAGALPRRQPGGLDRLLAAAHAMHLPRHVQVLIDDSLTELESGDFGEESEDFCGLERLYLLRGSALYYKGYLVASHLPPADQAAVQLLLRHRQLLERSRRGSWRQLVVWRRYRRPAAAPGAEVAAGAETGDSRAEAYEGEELDQYLLVVGAGHALLAVLLESSSCTAQVPPAAGPDCVYVEEAQATLFQLEAMGILDMCDSWLGGDPSLNSSAEEELPGGARLFQGTAREALLERRWWSRLVAARPTDSRRSWDGRESAADGAAAVPEESRGPGSSPWRPDTPAGSQSSARGPGRPESRSQSEDGGSSTDDSAADTWEIYRGPPKSRLLPNQYDLMENKKIYMSQALEDSRRVVSDSFSVALQHVLLNESSATYLALPEPLLQAWLRPELLTAFSAAVARLRRRLTPVAGGLSGPPVGCGASREEGTLFTLDGQQGQTFWVVGRQMSPRQLFVCVAGDTPPNMVDLAFRLAHATGPW